jgi:hypothetical protein
MVQLKLQGTAPKHNISMCIMDFSEIDIPMIAALGILEIITQVTLTWVWT